MRSSLHIRAQPPPAPDARRRGAGGFAREAEPKTPAGRVHRPQGAPRTCPLDHYIDNNDFIKREEVEME
jgi:hypothetical protein